jgi:hypothetical protein
LKNAPGAKLAFSPGLYDWQVTDPVVTQSISMEVAVTVPLLVTVKTAVYDPEF